jgi:hypothetical protein
MCKAVLFVSKDIFWESGSKSPFFCCGWRAWATHPSLAVRRPYCLRSSDTRPFHGVSPAITRSGPERPKYQLPKIC